MLLEAVYLTSWILLDVFGVIYDMRVYIFGSRVSQKNVFLISTSTYERELKEIRSCTKVWRPLLIGCKGSLLMGVVFLPSSFKILTLM